MPSTPPDIGQPAREARTGREDRGQRGNKWWTLVAVCLGTFMLLLDITIVTVALPDIQRALHSSFADLQWVVDAYALTLASFLLTAGSLADIYGRRVLYLIGLVVFTGASALCGFATSTLMLQLSRGLQGVGGAIMFAVSLALLANAFRGKDRGTAFGVWGAVTGIATAAGPVLGGLITTDWDWRGIFLVNIPIGIFAVAVTIVRVEESRAPRPTRPDWAGFGLLTVGLVGFIYGLIRASETSWTNTGVLTCVAVGLALLAAFVWAETKVANPMFDMRLLRVPTFAGGSISAFAMNGSLYAVLLYLVIYLQDILGYSALGAGLRVSVITLATMVTATIAGRLSEHMPVRWLIGPGLLLTGIGLIVMAGLTGTSSWTHLIPGFFIAGLGSGMVNPPLASTAIGVVPPPQAGMASGANSTFRQVGIATGIAALGSIFVSQMQSHLSSALPSSLAGSAGTIAAAVRQGSIGQVLASVPAADRGATVLAIRSSFASGLNDLLYITAALALAGAVCSLLLIRSKDFVKREAAGPGTASAADSPAPAPART